MNAAYITKFAERSITCILLLGCTLSFHLSRWGYQHVVKQRKLHSFLLYNHKIILPDGIQEPAIVFNSIAADFIKNSTFTKATSDDFRDKINAFGRETLSQVKIPHVKDEAWRFININRFFSKQYDRSTKVSSWITKSHIAKYVNDENKDSTIVFVDGVFNSELSSISSIKNDVEISCLSKGDIISSQAWEHLTYVPNKYSLPRQSYGSDVFTGINLAKLSDLMHIKVGANINISSPVQILYCSQASADSADISSSYPRLLVDLGDNSKLSLRQIQATITEGDKNNLDELSNFICGHTSFHLGSDSTLDHTIIQELSEATRSSEVITSVIKSNAKYSLYLFQLGSQINRINIHVNLTEPNATCNLNGAMLGKEDQVLDLHSSIHHLAESTNSNQQQRIVLGDRGRGIFKGYIQLPREANFSQADQLCRGFMLGEIARMQAMPVLEINTGNIGCSHGVAIADLDDNSMFYLESRGLAKAVARKLLMTQFVLQCMDGADIDKPTRDRILERLEILKSSAESTGLGRTAQQKITM